MAIEIGSYEAKTRLAELLRGVQAGNSYVITLRGQPIAELVPPQRRVDAERAAADMRRFMREGAQRGAGVDLRQWIDEGRA